MVGAGAGHAAVVAVLLARGASPLKWDAGGRCAVHHAAARGRLLSLGASPLRCAVHHVAARGRPDILRALLGAAHTSHLRTSQARSQGGGLGQLGNLGVGSANGNRKMFGIKLDAWGRTPLHEAAEEVGRCRLTASNPALKAKRLMIQRSRL